MKDVFDRVKKEKPISIHDLKAEINSLKTKVVQLKRRIEILELVNCANIPEDDNDKEDNLNLFERIFKC